MSKSVVFAALSLTALGFVVAPSFAGGERCRAIASAQERWSSAVLERQIFFAVLEGLYTDGVSNEAVDAITAIDPVHGYPANFVWNCPACMPAYEAMLTYRARPKLDRKSPLEPIGPGLDAATLNSLTRGEIGARQQAIMGLVERWLARRADELRLTSEEREVWELDMQMRRKKGMSMLQQYKADRLGGSYADMKDCPFCDGVNNPFQRKLAGK